MLDFDVIETPENVELQRRLAGIGSRFVAGFVDVCVIVGIYLLLFIILLFTPLWDEVTVESTAWETLSTASWAIAILILIAFLVHWGYFVFFEYVTNGQSPGKKVQKIRVVKEGGGPMSFTDVVIRNLLRAVDILPIGYGVAGVSMMLTQKMQRLGDLAAGTVVISEEVRNYGAKTDKKSKADWEVVVPQEAATATGLERDELRVLMSYWSRREQFSLDARRRLLPSILRPMFERRGQQLSTDSLPALESYVERVIELVARGETTPPTRGEG